MTSKQKGFTLTELLTVVTIIVVLGLAVLTQINPSTQIFKSFDTRRKADLNKIKIALENYYADHECYPNFPVDPTFHRPYYVCNSDFLKPYLSPIPCDPNTKTPYTIRLSPTDTDCPQAYAVYANINFKGDDQAQKIPACPNTYYVSSPNATYSDIISGCYDPSECAVSYGCVNGACVVVAEYTQPYCAPTFCNDPTCDPITREDGSILDCTSKNVGGDYTRECTIGN